MTLSRGRLLRSLVMISILAAAGCSSGRHRASHRKGPPPPVGTALNDDPPPAAPPPPTPQPPPAPSRPAVAAAPESERPPAPPPRRPRPVVKEPPAPAPSTCGARGAGESFAVQGVDASDVLNVRAEPAASSAILGSLPPDATGISVVDDHRRARRSSWQKVECGKLRGWVNGRFLAREKHN
jgi:hypothetical protein